MNKRGERETTTMTTTLTTLLHFVRFCVHSTCIKKIAIAHICVLVVFCSLDIERTDEICEK